MFILTPGQIQLPVKIQTARGLYREADKALCNRRHTAPRFFAQNLRADLHIPPKQQAQPLACQDHLQQLPAAHTLERVLREKDHGNAIIARFRERLSRLLRRFFKKACEICVIMPTPSPVVPSASLPVRCSSFSTILSASSTARCVFCPLILTTAPMPQASCCVCASKGRYWCGCIMLFFPLFRCKARPLPAPYSE